MPKLTVWAARSALLHLVLGATIGALVLWDAGSPLAPGIRRLLPAHREMLLVGWMVQLALAVAFWILPRFGAGDRRRRASLAWAGLALLNLGVHLTAWAGPFGWPALIVAGGRALELGGAAMVVVHAWPRVKPFGV